MKKRADGLYRKKATINGKQRDFYGKTIKEIEEKIFKARKEPTVETSQSTRFGYWADKWWEAHKVKISHNTQVCYARPLEDCKNHFKGYSIDKIKPLDVSEFIGELCELEYARQTVKVRLIVLNKIFDFAVLNSVIAVNPTKAVELPQGLSHKERETLTDEQIKRVRSGKNLFALFLLYTGMRRNEALAINWSDIDFKNNQITVSKQLLWKTASPPEIVDNVKSKSGVRVIPLLKPLATRLRKEKCKKGLLFSYRGQLMTKCGYKYLWEGVQKELDLEGVSAHQFRHAYITMLWASGIDVKTAQKLAGHSKVELMLDIYTHLDNQATESAAQKLNEYLKSKGVVKGVESKIIAV